MRLLLHCFSAVGGAHRAMTTTKINRWRGNGAWTVLLALSVLAAASSAPAQCPPNYAQNFDGVTPPALPSGWVASQGVNVTGAPFWRTSTIMPDTPPNDAFSTA